MLEADPNVSSYRAARTYLRRRASLSGGIRDGFLLLSGVFMAAFGLKGFILSKHFIDGGATGVALLINQLMGWPLPALLLILNAPFVFMAYRMVGRTFALKTGLAMVMLAAVLGWVSFPVVTQDNLLISVFGGFFLGAGIGLSVRGGGVIDGTEVLAIYLSRKTGLTIGDIIIGINACIFSLAAYLLSIETALYSMITYLAASRTLDFIVEGIEEYLGVTIVSAHSEEIRKMIINDLGRGVTVYMGKRGYRTEGEEKTVEVVFTVVTRLELHRLKSEIEKIDPNAFVVMGVVKETRGGMIKKRPFQH
jgi:uncharacterized membrane-anchored protein YitT (DUF2179 family)